MRAAILGLLLVGMLGGCHARFRRAAPHLEAVRPQVLGAERPSVRIAQEQDEMGLVRLAEGNLRAGVRDKLERSVDVDRMHAAFEASLADALDGGPPFGITDEEEAPLLQVEVLEYGLVVPQVGRQGMFSYTLKIRLYDRRGRRVYSTRVSCATPAGDPRAISLGLGTVNNVRVIEQMRPEEIRATFDQAARDCGTELAIQMRKHASPGPLSELRLAANQAERVLDRIDPEWEEVVDPR